MSGGSGVTDVVLLVYSIITYMSPLLWKSLSLFSLALSPLAYDQESLLMTSVPSPPEKGIY